MARWSVLAPEDLLFLANVKHDLHRYDEAISYLKQLVAVRPAFDRIDRALFGLMCKDAVDAIRSELKVFDGALTDQPQPAVVDRITELRDRSRARLDGLCSEVIDIAKSQLLPNALDSSGQVFFQKLIGDMYRYRAEHSVSEDWRAEAEKAYTKGMEIAERNGVSVFDSVRLGLTLNFAVLAYEHNGNPQKAIELVKTALEQVRNCPTKMTPEESNEVLPVIQAMHSNLRNWDASEEESVEE
jgi:14-3-3 protein epsilon